MKIAIGSDHGGFKLKEKLVQFLRKAKFQVVDRGTYSQDSCDYPDFGYRVAMDVAKRKAQRGVLICKSGVGMSIAANKIPGIRAVLAYDKSQAIFSRLHNDTNVITFGASFINSKKAKDILRAWLSTDFEGGRHKRRLKKIKDIEMKFLRKIK